MHEVWIRAKRSWLFWVVLSISIFFTLSSLIITVDSIKRIDQFGLLIIDFWPILFPLVYLLWIQNKLITSLWMKVAEINGWEYKSSSDPKEELGIMFQQGHSGTIFRRIDGVVDGRKFRMFNYTFTVGSGKYQRVYSYTVFAFKFNGSFPHIYLNNKHNSYSISIGEKIPLPSDFEKQFILSTPKKYEMEALEIFTPDILSKMLDKKFSHDVELVGSEVVLFIDGIVTSFEQLERGFDTALELEDLFDEKLDRFKFEKIGDMSHQLK